MFQKDSFLSGALATASLVAFGWSPWPDRLMVRVGLVAIGVGAAIFAALWSHEARNQGANEAQPHG